MIFLFFAINDQIDLVASSVTTEQFVNHISSSGNHEVFLPLQETNFATISCLLENYTLTK